MSSVCGIRQVQSQAHAYYVTQFTYKSWTADESLHYFIFPSETQNGRLHCTQELKPLDISYDQIFSKDLHKLRVPRVKKNNKKNWQNS